MNKNVPKTHTPSSKNTQIHTYRRKSLRRKTLKKPYELNLYGSLQTHKRFKGTGGKTSSTLEKKSQFKEAAKFYQLLLN